MALGKGFSLAAGGLALVLALPAATDSGAPVRNVPADAVVGLSDESFAVRERATAELWAKGDDALPDLQRALESGNPEAEMRARDLIRKIELGILPDSSLRIVALVLQYDRGGAEEKRSAIRELRKEKAYRQILKLYALERDPEVIAMLDDEARTVAMDAARDCLSEKTPDVDGAIRYLDMSRPGTSEMLAKAVLLRGTGRLEKELEKAAGMAGEEGHRWRYALHAAAGRVPEAAAEAEKGGLYDIAARLTLITGDPLPWITLSKPSHQTIPADGLPSYRDFTIRTWTGREIPAELRRTLRRHVRTVDPESRTRELRLLFLSGDVEEAEKQLASHSRIAAFNYFETAERIDEALKVIGLDPAKPDYTSWAAGRFRTLPEDDSTGAELLDLCVFGQFLESRGLLAELEEAFDAPLLELARADQEAYLGSAKTLFRGYFTRHSHPQGFFSCVRPVLRSVAGFAGDDDLRWGMAVASLFDFTDDPDGLWAATARLDPALDRPARLEWLAKTFGFLPDPDGAGERFMELGWKAVEKEEGVARRNQVELLGLVAGWTNNYPAALRCMEELSLDESAYGLRRRALLLAQLQRWEEAADIFVRCLENAPADVTSRASLAVCLRRLGDEKGADREEGLLGLFCLGDLLANAECGRIFYYYGDIPRANAWYLRSATECTRDQDSFMDSLTRLADQAMEDGNWQVYAGYQEATAFHNALTGSEPYQIDESFFISNDLKARIDARMSRALSRLKQEPEAAAKEIGEVSQLPFVENAFADYAFEPLRAARMTEVHDAIFGRFRDHLVKCIERFPMCANTHNSLAWLSARAMRELPEARRQVDRALELQPGQPAYLDTLAEVQFAEGDRAAAVATSTRAVEISKDFMMLRQHQRFIAGDFPQK